MHDERSKEIEGCREMIKALPKIDKMGELNSVSVFEKIFLKSYVEVVMTNLPSSVRYNELNKLKTMRWLGLKRSQNQLFSLFHDAFVMYNGDHRTATVKDLFKNKQDMWDQISELWNFQYFQGTLSQVEDLISFKDFLEVKLGLKNPVD